MENLPIHEPKSQWSRYIMDDIDRAIKISVSFASTNTIRLIMIEMGFAGTRDARFSIKKETFF